MSVDGICRDCRKVIPGLPLCAGDVDDMCQCPRPPAPRSVALVKVEPKEIEKSKKVVWMSAAYISGHEYLRALGWLCSRCGKARPRDEDGRRLLRIPRCRGERPLLA